MVRGDFLPFSLVSEGGRRSPHSDENSFETDLALSLRLMEINLLQIHSLIYKVLLVFLFTLKIFCLPHYAPHEGHRGRVQPSSTKTQNHLHVVLVLIAADKCTYFQPCEADIPRKGLQAARGCLHTNSPLDEEQAKDDECHFIH